MEMIAENPGNISGWGTDHNGKLRIATTSDGVNTSLLYRDTESDKFKPILTTDFKVSVAPLFFTFDNKNLFVASNRGRDKTAIFEFDVNESKEGKLIFEHDEVDVSMVIQTLMKNAANAQNMIKEIIKTFKDYSVEKDPANGCLDVAIITDPKLRTKKTITKLKNIAGRVLNKKK